MRRTTTAALALAALLALTACGGETGAPGADDGPDERTTPSEDEATGPGGEDDEDDELLTDTRGEGEFFIDGLAVRQAESHPVQLFLDVQGHAPTPCHTVAYDAGSTGQNILVHLTTVEQTGMMCTQVLVPHEVSVPLGAAEDFPVTIDVNDGEHVLTVNG